MKRPRGIGFYAPAGFALDPPAIDRAQTRIVAMWERVTVDPTCRTRWQRFAASDDERLAAVMRMAHDPQVDLAITLRGGYGWTRLLPRIDFQGIYTHLNVVGDDQPYLDWQFNRFTAVLAALSV